MREPVPQLAYSTRWSGSSLKLRAEALLWAAVSFAAALVVFFAISVRSEAALPALVLLLPASGVAAGRWWVHVNRALDANYRAAVRSPLIILSILLGGTPMVFLVDTAPSHMAILLLFYGVPLAVVLVFRQPQRENRPRRLRRSA